jgi:uncharacterized protein with gpF-like domain
VIDFTIADFFAADAGPVKRSRSREIIGAAIQPNAGLEAAYRKRLETMIDEMHVSVLHFVTVAYRRDPPKIAQDELASTALKAALRKLVARWTGRFDGMARKLSLYFAKNAAQRSDASLKRILKDGGWTVEFRLTAAQRDVLNAIVNENVSLIKSIPRESLQQVEGIVMRSIAAGYDLQQLTIDLRKQFGVTKRRAKLIASDQTKKSNAMLTRQRHLEVGITEARWCHSAAGKEPRPTHVKAGRDRVIFDLREGWLDPAINKRIWPGTEINCRCYARPIIPALGRSS